MAMDPRVKCLALNPGAHGAPCGHDYIVTTVMLILSASALSGFNELLDITDNIRREMKHFRLALHWQILIALVLAVLVGVATDPTTTLFGISLNAVFTFIGTLFLNALKMLIVPLIMSSIIAGMMEIHPDTLGRLGSKTLIYYLASSLVAILIGLFVVNILQPGIADGEPVREMVGLAADTDAVVERVEGRGTGDIAEVFIRMIPANIVSAAAEGQMLGLIFFSLLFGFFTSRVKGRPGETLKNFWSGLLDVMMQMTEWVMLFAPVGVFALVAKVLMTSGLDAFGRWPFSLLRFYLH